VSCGFSEDWIALHAEGDLDGNARELTRCHLIGCRQCAALFEQLRDSQRLLKSLRQQTAMPDDCVRMRHGVMSAIGAHRFGIGGWLLAMERTFVLGVRRHAYALSALALVLISASVMAQNRSMLSGARSAAPIFVGRDALLLPEDYREWVAVTPPAGHRGGTEAGAVYINPEAYRQYEKTRTLPEGTVMIWEAGSGARGRQTLHQPAVLLASVKSQARFDSGWGFFDFTDVNGATLREAEALSDASSCRTCHVRGAAADQVLTEF
jgi:hypothetical protein